MLNKNKKQSVWKNPAIISAILVAVLGGTFTLLNTFSSAWISKSITSTPSPSTIETKLNNANIILAGGSTSENIEKMRSYLITDPALQILASQCLMKMNGRRFKRIVHLDTINGKYIMLVDAKSKYLSADKYYNLDKLERAMLIHWNEMNPNQKAANFGQIIE